MRISLVGLPGGGKSTIGRHLARRLNLPFSDSDHVIERRLGEPIRSFFERQGEDAFRDVEVEVIDELTRTVDGVIATGGGAVIRSINRLVLRDRTTVVYLRSAPEDLFRRLRRDTRRPLLQVADPLARLRELSLERDPLYRSIAHFTVDTGRPSVSSLVSTIQMQMELSDGKGMTAD